MTHENDHNAPCLIAGLVGISEYVGVAVIAGTDITTAGGSLRFAENVLYQSCLASMEPGISEVAPRIAPALGWPARHAAE
jgi:hypothetical protein